jgi:hypothetical protein
MSLLVILLLILVFYIIAKITAFNLKIMGGVLLAIIIFVLLILIF